jgi:membrane protease YdiL (CAAX protease family)
MSAQDEKHAPLWTLCLLVIIIYFIQFGMVNLRKWMAPEGNMLKLLVLANQIVSIFLPIMLFIIILRLPFRKSLGLNPAPLWKTIIAVLLGFAVIFEVDYTLPHLIAPSQEYAATTTSIVSYSNLPELLFTLLLIAIVAPLADEFFFRGLLLQDINGRWGKVAAVLITAALTALFHTLEPFKLAHAFIMGVIFACMVVWTRSVYTSLILHCFNNLLSLIPAIMGK